MYHPERKVRVAVLGATGTVGQRMLSLLEDHPWFEVVALAASDASAGRPYGEVVRWHLETPLPEAFAGPIVARCAPDAFECDLALSALHNSVAGDIETAFADAGVPVVTNAKNHRMEDDVPLVVPEVNPEHLAAVERQMERRGGRGFIVTNPNCSTVGLVCALKPLADAFGVRKVVVTTMQAISGAGYPGVPAADILDNVLPHIGGEEEKMRTESRKILGSYGTEGFVPADTAVSASCNRVMVRDGHTECVSVELGRPATADEVRAAWLGFRPAIADLGLPTAPERFIAVDDRPDRPQPRLDRGAGRGMTVTVGRLRPCEVLHHKFVVLSHNTVRGAAGAAVANAELLAAKGLVGVGEDS